MKIVINLRKLSKKPSGIGIYTYNLVKVLLELDKVELVGVTDILESKEILELNKKMKIYTYEKEINKNIDVFKYYYYLKKILRRELPQYYWETNNIIPWYLKIKGMKIITTIHDFFAITDSKYINKIYIYYYKICMLLTLKQSNKIVCVSNKTKQELNELYKGRIKEKNLKVIYNLVEKNKYKLTKDVTEEKFYLYLGTINKRKGCHILLDAYKKYLLENEKTIKLILAGGIDDYELLEKIEEIKKIKKFSIDYKGYISEEEKEQLLQKCEAFIFPSLAEGFGIPPLEALKYDKPLILSNLEIFYEILGENNNYFILETNDEKSAINLSKILKSNLEKNNNVEQIFENVSKKTILVKVLELINDK